ncbi:MAG: L,D-transpeptidase family protein [Syntrophobacterales bacterium]|nr:L,D-transpeptidase family protein [Syntrophobacterales bacterium]
MRRWLHRRMLFVLCLSTLTVTMVSGVWGGDEEEFPIRPPKKYSYSYPDRTVIGAIQYHVIKNRETFLDIARRYELGINELELLYTSMDPWVPPPGLKVIIPTIWVIPPTKYGGIVLNIPEFRLYFFRPTEGTVQTYPVGIGDEGWETPTGIYRIESKRENPTWYIPPSLQEKYGATTMPPGPDNPLGKFMMKFAPMYGIHGTHIPWGVGRLVSHGCIRTYPEHIAVLYPQVSIGTPVEIIYEPIKFGMREGRIFVEVHPDVYKKLKDFMDYGLRQLEASPLRDRIDRSRYVTALTLQNGMPTDVTKDGGVAISSMLH